MFREVTREKQALPKAKINEILNTEKRGVLSVLSDNGYPYGLPMNYLYDEESGYIYFHSGKKGHKIDALRTDNRVSFCVYDKGYQNEGEWALNISSVIVFGKIHIVDDFEKALKIYRNLSLKFTSDTEYIESEIEKFAENTLCLELCPEHITGKKVNEA